VVIHAKDLECKALLILDVRVDVCEIYFGCVLGQSGLYKQLRAALIVTNHFGILCKCD
jgi:hypothetical protein